MRVLAHEIKSRGYFRFVVRPTTFLSGRIPDRPSLETLVRGVTIKLRGWDFPHWDSAEPLDEGPDWIGQDCCKTEMKESWRLFQSGQFAYIAAVRSDWVTQKIPWLKWEDQQRIRVLGYVETVGLFAGLFEFAAAVCLSRAGDEPMFVSIGVHGLRERFPWVDSLERAPHPHPKPCVVEEFVQADVFSREVLVNGHREYGIDWAHRLFTQMNGFVSREQLASMADDWS